MEYQESANIQHKMSNISPVLTFRLVLGTLVSIFHVIMTPVYIVSKNLLIELLRTVIEGYEVVLIAVVSALHALMFIETRPNRGHKVRTSMQR